MHNKLLIIATLLGATPLMASPLGQPNRLGVVSARVCLETSKPAQRIRSRLEQMNQDIEKELEQLQKKVDAIGKQLNDKNYIKSLKEDAVKKLENEYGTLLQEMEQKRTELTQKLQQTRMQMVHQLLDYISKASEKIAQKHKLDCVMSEDAVTFFKKELDVTQEVVTEIDKMDAGTQ